MDALRISLKSEADTRALAEAIAPTLKSGDTVLLDGPIGAGKTFFARALIQARLRSADIEEDVPSPTFTLVQTYWDGSDEIWHADLYRLSGPDDIAELGLDEAFDEAICLIEWPDRLGDLAPKDALVLGFAAGPGDTVREIRADGPDLWLLRLAEILSVQIAD